VDRRILKMDPRQQLAGITQYEDGSAVEMFRWDV
jgi:hypothetical protein